MNTFEIVIQRQVEDAWPVVAVHSRPDEFLPRRTEDRLQLDLEVLETLPDPATYGETLGRALFQDELRAALARAHSQADQDGEPLRVLITIEAEVLKPLHWERLWAPLDGIWDYLCLNQSTPLSRYLPALTDRRYPPIGRRDLRSARGTTSVSAAAGRMERDTVAGAGGQRRESDAEHSAIVHQLGLGRSSQHAQAAASERDVESAA